MAVHQDYRRAGVYGKLVRFTYELEGQLGISFHYGINTQRATIRESQKMGHLDLPHNKYISIRIKDVNRHLEENYVKYAFLKRLGYRALADFNRFRYSIGKPDRSPTDFSIHEIKEFDDRFSRFWGDVESHYGFIVERSKNYLNWRFTDPRAGDFARNVAENDGRVLGYIVLRTNMFKEDYPQGFIVDLLALSSRLDVAEALVSKACEFFDDKGINVVNAVAVKGHPYEVVLKRFGFVNVLKRNLTYRPHEGIREAVNGLRSSPASTNLFTFGDYDAI